MVAVAVPRADIEPSEQAAPDAGPGHLVSDAEEAFEGHIVPRGTAVVQDPPDPDVRG